MKTYLLADEVQVIGRAGEQGGITIAVDVSAWQEEYQDGVGGIMATRPGGGRMPLVTTISGALMLAELPQECTDRPGSYEYTATWTLAGTIEASQTYRAIILSSEIERGIPQEGLHNRTPDWAKEIYIKAEQILNSVDAALQMEQYAVDAEAARDEAVEAKGIAVEAETVCSEVLDIVNASTETIAAMHEAADGIEAQKDTMIASIAAIAEMGTDPTLTQTGVAADAKAAGDLTKELKNNLLRHNSINVLDQTTKNQASTEYNGTTYTISDGVWMVSGTTSANFTRKIFESLSVLPTWFAPGRTIYIRMNKTGSMDSMRLVIYPAYNGTVDASNTLVDTRTDLDYTVPSDYSGSGLQVRLYASKNVTLDGTVFPEFLQAPGNDELLNEIMNVNADSIRFVSDPATTYEGLTLAEVNDNVRMLVAKANFSDIPYSGQCLTFQTTASYNVQLLVRNSTGEIFTRIVNRTDHTVYRDWAQHALLNEVDSIARFDGKKIYCDGDSIMVGVITTSPEYPSRTVASPNIPDAIAARLPNATVDNKAHGGDYIRSMNDATVSICDSILADSTVSGYDYFVINGGTNDYTNDSGNNPTTLGTIDSNDTATFYGAYNAIMQYIFTQNPKARVLLITPCFRNYMHSTRGNAYEIQNNQGITLGDLCDAVINIGKKYAVPVYDSRVLGPVNAWNYTTLLVPRTESGTDAHIHPSQDGYTLYGDSIASYFIANN